MKAQPLVAPVEIEPGVFVSPGPGNGALPLVVPKLSIEVMERTVGGIVFDDGGVRWSPLREIILQPGVFHG